MPSIHLKTLKYIGFFILLHVLSTETEIRKCHGMENNVDKIKIIRISSVPIPLQLKIDQKQQEKLEYSNNLGSM